METTIKAFKTRIYPTKNQKEYFHKAFGIRRFVWNWGLNEYLKCLKQGERKSAFDLQKQLNNIFVKQSEYSWLSSVNSMVRQESLKDLGLSIKKYHEQQRSARKTTNTVNTEKCKPKFKSKKKCQNSFRMNNKGNPLRYISKHYVRLTTVGGASKAFRIKTAESLGFLNECRLCTVTISENGNKYYLTVSYEKTNHIKNCKNENLVGIDMGVKTPLTCVDSLGNIKKFEIPSSLYKAEKKNQENR